MKSKHTQLDEYQSAIVNTPYNPSSLTMVKAVAGAGKSHTILNRALKLVTEYNVDPKQIVLTSFTNNSARELLTRWRKLHDKPTFISTLHGLAREILKMTPKYVDFATATEWNSMLVMRDKLASHINYGNKSKTEQSNVCFYILELYSKFRSLNTISPSTLESDLHKEKIPYIEYLSRDDIFNLILFYQKEKANLRILDYDDIIWLAVHELRDNPDLLKKAREKFTHYFIDEAQDLNPAQYHLIQLLGTGQYLTLVGDLCQSIYGFRYASPKLFSPSFFGTANFNIHKEFTLENNYRSKEAIVKLSNLARKVAHSNIEAKAKADNNTPDERPVRFIHTANQLLEGNDLVSRQIPLLLQDGYKYSDICIIARSNRFIKTILEPALTKHNIPYRLEARGNRRKLIDNPLAQFYFDSLSLLVNPSNHHPLATLLTKLKGVGQTNIPRVVQEYANTHTSTSPATKLFLGLLARLRDESDLYVVLNTIKLHIEEHCLSEVRESSRNDDIVHNAMCNYISLQRELDPTITPKDLLLKMLSEIDSFTKPNRDTDCVLLATVHSQKGCEHPVCFACGFVSLQQLKEKEEANILYVQLSRAIDKLIIYNAKEYVSKDGNVVTSYRNPYFDELLKLAFKSK